MRTKNLIILFISLLFLWRAVQLSGHSQVLDPLPALKWDGTLRRIAVPILMYHYVSPLPEDADDIRINLTVTPDLFRAHLAYLRDAGYSLISLYEVNAALLTGMPLPDKPIVLTFDDGYIDHYTYVFPALREFGFTATFFIITNRADQNASGYLSWAQIREMSDAGMSMEAHTKSHLDLRERDSDFLIYEILGSLESVSVHTNTERHMFAYPGGRYDNKTLEIMRQLPVWHAVTTENGTFQTSDNRLEMPRLRVSGNMSVTGLAHLLANRN